MDDLIDVRLNRGMIEALEQENVMKLEGGIYSMNESCFQCVAVGIVASRPKESKKSRQLLGAETVSDRHVKSESNVPSERRPIQGQVETNAVRALGLTYTDNPS